MLIDEFSIGSGLTSSGDACGDWPIDFSRASSAVDEIDIVIFNN